MSIKFLVSGGGYFGFGGGRSADFIFMGAGIFLTLEWPQIALSDELLRRALVRGPLSFTAEKMGSDGSNHINQPNFGTLG